MRALLLLSAVACASPTRLGRVETQGSRDGAPGSRARQIDVDESGIEMRWVGGYATLHVPEKDGCARAVISRNVSTSREAPSGRSIFQKVLLCPLEEPGRWRAEIERTTFQNAIPSMPVKDSFEYEMTLLEDGCVSVGRNGASWSIETPRGPLGDALRKHPELVAAAVALRLLPIRRANNLALTNAAY
jgi:hypothetical protein